MLTQTVLTKQIKESPVAKLSLISLMDIFTILVFFLMLNSGETQDIETAKVLELPDSVAGKSPHTDLMLVVSQEALIFDDEQIARVDEILETPDSLIEALSLVLQAQKEDFGDEAELQEQIGHAITIQADKNIDYSLLKRVMETCQAENFRNISLAVNRIRDIPLSADPAEQQPSDPIDNTENTVDASQLSVLEEAK